MVNESLFNSDIFDKDYFENGLVTGKSCYINYRWLPELTIKMAHRIIKYLDIHENHKVLDYGCSKGYLTKAFRILDVDAYGCDISQYAIDSVDAEVRPYCRLIDKSNLIPFQEFNFDWLVTKDVLEHMSEDNIDAFLACSVTRTQNMFHIIPLGDQNVFRISAYHDDVTHIQIQNEEWWTRKFLSHGWILTDFTYAIRGIKSNWTDMYSNGNGFFTVRRR